MTSPREGFDHGRFFAAYDVAHVVRMFDLTGQLLHEVQGCEGNIGNAEELQRADPQRFFFRPFMHDVAFGADTVLYHFSPTADDGYHRLERYTTDGKRLEPTLVPGRERGGPI
ncbi:MAG: hypothetical protein OEZ42_10670, partial [Gemmatimonadota bacterium]|nr:hypothetical protein [Gemmatimonadota bacterium]